MSWNKEKIVEIVNFYFENGEEKTLEVYSLKQDSLRRYLNEYRKIDNSSNIKNVLRRIQEVYSDKELIAIANGGRLVPGQDKVPIVDFDGEHIRIGFITDTHIGSVYFKEEYFNKAIEEIIKSKCDMLCHAGDVTDGMNIKRHGQIYELTHLGYDAQLEYAAELFRGIDIRTFMIDGNHDRWYMKTNGANIVKEIAHRIGATYLGSDEGDISLKGKAVVKLWHGEDGSSYATSYRLQKLIESFTGGEKPNILLAGHTHKMAYIFERHVHTFSGGALSTQSSWMRGKRLSNHTGFWIIDVWVGKRGITKCGGIFYPYYA